MNRALFACVLAAALLALVPAARAQSFNIDMGSSTHPAPSPSFGGGANQPGFWNSVDESSAPPFLRALLDLNGQPTGVTIALTTFGSAFLAPNIRPNQPGLSADEAALYADSVVLNSPGPATFTLTITGLAPGAYDYYGYVGDEWNEGSFYTCGTNFACTYFDGTFSYGSVWNQRCCETSTGNVSMNIGTCGSPLSYAAVNGFQIVRRAFSCADVSEGFCSGDAAGGACACPCGNCGLAGRGCENSFATGGGRLFTSGTASVSADTLVLHGDFVPPTTSALFYQGTGFQNGGFGAVYGDGLRCVGGSAIRLGSRIAANGIVAFGAGQSSDPHVSAAGLIPAAGGTRYYQVWYRNAPTYCTPATVNLTNGFKVRWAP